MNGAEHYREAERLLGDADGHPHGTTYAAELLVRAQIHATLALAAATALPSINEVVEIDDDAKAWARATAPEDES